MFLPLGLQLLLPQNECGGITSRREPCMGVEGHLLHRTKSILMTIPLIGCPFAAKMNNLLHPSAMAQREQEASAVATIRHSTKSVTQYDC